LDNGKESFIPTEEIERVDVKLTPEQQAGEKLLEQGDYRAAAEQLRAALQLETRPWLRSRLQSRVVSTQIALGDTAAAIDAFLAASQGGSAEVPWTAMPLGWLPEPPAGRVRQVASRLVRSSNPLQQLVGASHLLDTDESAAARDALAKLTTRDERIGSIARAQLWRWEVATATPADVESWRRQLVKLPAELRGAPHFVIGLALNRLGRHEEAALEFLWPALVYRNDMPVSSRAALLAGQSLEQVGQPAEAKGLYQELIARFARTADAAAAQSRLDRLKE
jgi:tetratricopeptide (TPR) repeat protein